MPSWVHGVELLYFEISQVIDCLMSHVCPTVLPQDFYTTTPKRGQGIPEQFLTNNGELFEAVAKYAVRTSLPAVVYRDAAKYSGGPLIGDMVRDLELGANQEHPDSANTDRVGTGTATSPTPVNQLKKKRISFALYSGSI